MSDRSEIVVSSRRQPKQSRSNHLVATILQAAAQVLAEEGAPRFTTARVAERAGVSIGSLYQYFPNKASILFRLQSDEWRETTELLRTLLEDRTTSPLARLRALVHAFIHSECEEAAVRGALDDAAPLYRDTPEARAARVEGEQVFARFMIEALPHLSVPARAIASDLIVTTLRTVGKAFSETAHTPADITAYADAMADMFSAYVVMCANAAKRV